MTVLRGTPIDSSLLVAAQSGDPQALAGLLKIAQPDIRRYARRNCRTASDIDDAVQETLILLYRKIRSLRAVESFSYWLFRVVDRVCLRLARRLMGIQTAIDELEDQVLSVATDATLRMDLVSAIESLPEQYRQVIIMRDVSELTVEEIAQQLAITRPTVKARLHRARLLVREYILK